MKLVPVEPIQDTDNHAGNDERDKHYNLLALGIAMQESRMAAINFRQASGIERIWMEDEEYYEGIDDENRDSHASDYSTKPPGQHTPQSQAPRSTVFPNITRPYCDSAAARTGDTMLPTDDKAWALNCTPVIELTPMAEGKLPLDIKDQIREANTEPVMDANGNQMLDDRGEPMTSVNEEIVAKTEAEIIEFAKREMEVARAAMEKAEKRIDDWHVECQYHAEVRKVIDNTCQMGSGVLKGPVPQKRRHFAYDKASNSLVIKEEVKPGSVSISPWDFYPDPACGENLHNGDHCWEKDKITPKALHDLKGTPGYLDEQIDIVLAQGPHEAKGTETADDATYDQRGLIRREDSNMYDIWYFHGYLNKEQMVAAGVEEDDMPESVNLIPAQLTMVNNRPIKVIINPNDTGELPYDIMVWQKRKKSCWGIGVARQVRTPQDIVKGALRMIMDNAGIAGGPQIIVQRGVIQPADGVFDVRPLKMWVAGKDADTKGLDKAFRFEIIPMLQESLQAIYEMGMRLAEEVTGMPMLMQGQLSNATPDTLGGQQLQVDNASTVLRRFARLFDDMLTEPHIRRYYAYLLQYGKDDEKGEFVVDARGSSALVEREIHSRDLMEVGELAQNPVYGLDPKRWIAEFLKSKRLDVRRFEYDDEEWQKIVEGLAASAQQGGDSSVEVANIKSQTDLEKQKMVSADKAADRESKEQIEASKLAISEAYKEVEEQIKAAELALDNYKVEGSREDFAAKLKADMAKHLQTLKTQIALSMGDGGQVMEPVAEPPQRAPAGEAFTQ